MSAELIIIDDAIVYLSEVSQFDECYELIATVNGNQIKYWKADIAAVRPENICEKYITYGNIIFMMYTRGVCVVKFGQRRFYFQKVLPVVMV